MRLCTIRKDDREQAAVVTRAGVVPVAAINAHLKRSWPEELYGLIQHGISTSLLADAEQTPFKIEPETVRYGPLYRHPRKILGIGLNYRDHAVDLNAPYPTEPASFMEIRPFNPSETRGTSLPGVPGTSGTPSAAELTNGAPKRA